MESVIHEVLFPHLEEEDFAVLRLIERIGDEGITCEDILKRRSLSEAAVMRVLVKLRRAGLIFSVSIPADEDGAKYSKNYYKPSAAIWRSDKEDKEAVLKVIEKVGEDGITKERIQKETSINRAAVINAIDELRQARFIVDVPIKVEENGRFILQNFYISATVHRSKTEKEATAILHLIERMGNVGITKEGILNETKMQRIAVATAISILKDAGLIVDIPKPVRNENGKCLIKTFFVSMAGKKE